MPSEPFDKGDLVRFAVTFRNILSSPADPSTISLRLRSPSQVESTYTFGGPEIQKLSTGSYYMDFILTQSGRWGYRWTGTGTVAAASEGNMYVEQSAFT